MARARRSTKPRIVRKVGSPRFPIMAWNWTPTDAATLAGMKECGLTVAGFVAPAGLNAVARAGLKAIVTDPKLSAHDWRTADPAAVARAVGSVVKATHKHPAVLGYYIKDEPSAEEFAGLSAAAGEVRRLAPQHWAYINLFPDYASTEQLGSRTYAEHVERFVTTCNPAVISYDNYSLMEREPVRLNYWTNLEAIRAAAMRHHRPFWNIVLSVAHFQYREATAADIRFQAFTTLAYGGRGLSYFTYFTPTIGNYRLGPIDQFGQRTPTWDHLRHVNHQIHNLAPTLLRLRSERVYHFGTVPAGSRGPDADSLVAGLRDAQAVVGDFTHDDGSRYVMIVNTGFEDSFWVKAEFRSAPAKVEIVSPYTGQLLPFTGEQRVLAPGQGSLLRLG